MIDQIDFVNPYLQSIFGGKTFNLIRSGPMEGYKNLDPINDYSVKNGYRSELFASEILVGGCSFTFGLGVPKETTWWNFVAKDLGKSVSSIALPGMSIGWIVEQIFVYFRTYGHPETLLCFFPDLGRTRVVVDGTTLSNSKSLGDGNGSGIHTVFTEDNNNTDKPNYIKKPYDVNYIYTYENSVFQSIRSIRMLEQYCSAAGIKFIWSTWHSNTTFLLDQLNSNKDFSFDSYFNIFGNGFGYYTKEGGINKQVIFQTKADIDACGLSHKNVECFCGLNCHDELRDLYGSDNFYLGADTLNGYESAHPGIHLQAHFAEEFLKKLRLISNNNG